MLFFLLSGKLVGLLIITNLLICKNKLLYSIWVDGLQRWPPKFCPLLCFLPVLPSEDGDYLYQLNLGWPYNLL